MVNVKQMMRKLMVMSPACTTELSKSLDFAKMAPRVRQACVSGGTAVKRAFVTTLVGVLCVRGVRMRPEASILD